MGWAVVGFGYMDFDKVEDAVKIYELITGDKAKIVDRLSNVQGCEIEDIDISGGEITFRMEGNKGIDYDKLDAIKSYCKEAKISIVIQVNEYVESEGGGYYYNSGEEEDEI